MKTVYILTIGIIFLATACSHSSGEGSSTPTTFGTELVIPPTFTTVPDADLNRILEEFGEDGSTAGEITGKIFSTLSPGSPEWNTYAIQRAKQRQPFAIEYNQCSISLDMFYDFENSNMTPIEKSIELSLRYNFEFSSILRWGTNFEVLNLSAEQYKILFSDSELLEADTLDFERIEVLNKEVRSILSEILGSRSIHSLLSDFANETLPSLKQGFADIGFESSNAEISKFQDIWAANLEIERIARTYLKLVEITETRLLDLLRDNNEIFYTEFFDFYFSLWQAFYEVVDREEIEPLARGIGDESLIGLSNSQEYKRVARAFLEPIAKQSAPAECINPDFP